MAAEYYTILTNDGIAYETDRKAKGLPIKLTKMSVGDGGGSVYNPDARAKALKREVWRGDINSILQDIDNPSWLVLELTLPDDVGGFYVREAAVWTDTGVMYAILKYPESYKPVAATSGSGKEFYLKAIFQTSNAANVVIQVDESIVKATRAWVVDYVGQELAKLDDKQSVRAATTGNITLAGAQTVDGVAVVPGDRVLVKNQSVGSQNGIYVVSTASWPRAADANTSAKVTPQLTVGVEQGVVNGDSCWFVQTDAPINLGSTALSFAMAYGRTGVAAGSYQKVTVDAQGRVVAGFNPTTLAEFGILDAFTKAETTKAVANAVAALVNSAPGSLDQLNELAAAIGNDPNFATTMINELAKKATLASPKLTGTPEAPTAAPGTDTPQIATMAALLAGMQNFGLGRVNGKDIDDLDDLPASGFYRGQSTAKNSPFPGAPITIVNVSFNQGGGLQLVGSCSSNIGNSRLYWRAQASGNWSEWQTISRLDSPHFTGEPTAPSPDATDKSNRLATQASVRSVLAYYGVGSNDSGRGLPGTLEELANMPSGNYYYPTAMSPYPEYAFVQRMAYGGNRGFEVANIPYTDRFFGRASNQNGTWRNPVELASLASPDFSGTPRVPTAPAGTNTSQIASTAFVAALAALKADLASPALSGTPTAPTAPKGTRSNQLATTLFVQDAVAALINSSPAALDTLSELAKALGNDPNFATTMISELAQKADLTSPALKGNPTAPTQALGDNDTSIATTAFVQAAMALYGIGSINPPSEAVGDIKSITKGGIYMYATNTPGAPTATAGVLLHLPRDSRPTQIAADYTAKKIFVRHATGTGTFSAWETFAMQESPSFTGEPSVKGANVMRYVNDIEAYGLIQRVDNGSYYMLLTDYGNPYGGWNALRPFQINLASGAVIMSQGASVLSPADDDVSNRVPNTAWVRRKVDAAAPPGQVAVFALPNPPTGWLKRNGAAYSRKVYADLFAAIGTTFGAGDGSTTFNVPDDRELVDKVWTDGLNVADPGRELFSKQLGQNEAHAHTGSTSQNGAHQHSTVFIREKITSNFVTEGGNAVFGDQMSDGTQSLTTSVGGVHTHTLNINDSGGSEVRVANRAYLGCIKY